MIPHQTQRNTHKHLEMYAHNDQTNAMLSYQ